VTDFFAIFSNTCDSKSPSSGDPGGVQPNSTKNLKNCVKNFNFSLR